MNFISQISSYLYPVRVEKRRGAFLPVLEVNIRNGKYILDGKKVNYSFGSLHEIFHQALIHHEVHKKNINSVLILGFGAGSVAHILQNELQMECSITGVEIDPVVIELAKDYFNAGSYRNTELICEDAFHFVRDHSETYDLIIVDVFVERRVPKAFLSTEFIRLVKKRLRPNGMLFFNRINDNAFQKGETISLMNLMKSLPNGRVDVYNVHQHSVDNVVLVHHAGNQNPLFPELAEEMECVCE